jgi:hypothetical protein
VRSREGDPAAGRNARPITGPWVSRASWTAAVAAGESSSPGACGAATSGPAWHIGPVTTGP